jgi:carboxymethylenebutenolidase
VEAVKAFEAEMHKQGVPHEVHVYADTAHAFFNDTHPQIYQAAAAQDAWQETLAWFRKYLTD